MSDNMDRISELPVDVVHRILSFVPLKDAARTSTLSKTWNEICRSYNITSSKTIDYYWNSRRLESGRYLDIHEKRVEFLTYATSELQIMKQTSLRVKDLTMNMALNDTEYSCADQMMELLSQTKVDNLDITVQTCDSSRPDDKLYDFPYSVLLASRWLQSLTLKNCRLSSAAGNVISLCTSLRKLKFSCVTVLDKEVLNNLACCCPRVESIKFEFCNLLMETLKLSDFPMLKEASVEIKYPRVLKVVDIRECTNLKSFHCTSFCARCFISPAACKSIRELTLCGSTPLFQDFTTAFPAIEIANIQAIGEFGDSFKAANVHMRDLTLSVLSFLNEITVECPSMKNFEFSGNGCQSMKVNCPNLRQLHWTGKFPPFLQQVVPATCSVTYTWLDINEINTSWFISLSEFLYQIGIGRHKIDLHFGFFLHMMAEFILDDFGPIMQASQLYNIHLNLLMQYADTVYSAALVDGLVWSTHPTTLTTAGYSYNTIKYLFEKLETHSRDESCCTDRFCNKFWWHNVEDYQVYKKGQTEDIMGNLGALLETYDTDKFEPCFKFLWRSSP